MAGVPIPQGVLFRLETIGAFHNGTYFEDLKVKGDEKIGGILFTYASDAGASSTPMMKQFRLPFSFFGLLKSGRGEREITKKDIEAVTGAMPRSIYVPNSK